MNNKYLWSVSNNSNDIVDIFCDNGDNHVSDKTYRVECKKMKILWVDKANRCRAWYVRKRTIAAGDICILLVFVYLIYKPFFFYYYYYYYFSSNKTPSFTRLIRKTQGYRYKHVYAKVVTEKRTVLRVRETMLFRHAHHRSPFGI